MHRLLAAAVALAVPLAVGAASAGDLVIRQRVKTGTGADAPAREEIVYVTADRMAMDGPRDRTIVDLPARTITLADKAEKTWFVVTIEQMRAQAEAVQQALRKQMESMPPDARAVMERMMDAGGQAATVTPTGKHETIAGYEADEYRVSAGAFSGTVWASKALPMPAGMARWKEMSLGATAPQGPGRTIAEAFAKVDGYPMRSNIAGGAEPARFSSTTEVLEVRETTVPPEMLAVPSGFRKVDPPSMTAPAPRAPRP